MLLDEEIGSFKYSQATLIFQNMCTTLDKVKDNSVLCLFHTLIYSLTYFCRLSYKIIISSNVEDSAFLNEYIKRVNIYKIFTAQIVHRRCYKLERPFREF